MIFRIDPDIRKARTLSSEFYIDERFFEISREKIFARTWQFLGTADEVDNLRPTNILEGFLNEPVLLVRNNDSIKCISNVCTHRGKILIEEPCRGSLLRCPYHGRRFSLDGKFLSMPEFEDAIDFPGPEDDLKSIEFARYSDFLFASLDPVCEFEAFLDGGPSPEELRKQSSLRLSSSREYELNAHWALYCENYLEGFHIPYVHHSLNSALDYGKYTTETFRYSSVQTGYDPKGSIAGRYWFIFPNLMFNFYSWGVSVNVVKPVSPGRTKVAFLTYVTDESKVGKGAGADLHRVEMEDEAVVESVQKGIRSRFYDRGRYSPSREQGTHHFHRLIAEFMA